MYIHHFMTTTLPLDERQQKGLIIAATSAIKRGGDGVFTVPSQSLNGKYRVDGNAKTCSCPDFELRQLPCKHVFAVEFVQRRETTTRPDGAVTVTETTGVRVTYSQDWSAYNRSQQVEREYFLRLLHDLCATVPTPPSTNGRPPLPLSDRLFAACFKVYSGKSSRRFSGELHEAKAKGLIDQAPHFNSVLNVIEDEEVTPVLHQLIEASALPLKEMEDSFAIDSTGFGTSTYFRYYSMKYHHEQIGKKWVKTHVTTGTRTNIVTAVFIGEQHAGDSPQFPGLLERTAASFDVKEVSADKAYASKENYQTCEKLDVTPYIAFRAGSKAVSTWKKGKRSALWEKMFHMFAFNRDEFLPHYHKRSNVETTFSMIKRKFGDSVRAKQDVSQMNEVLLKILCHNLVVLIHEMHELGITPVFQRLIGCTETAVAAHELPAV